MTTYEALAERLANRERIGLSETLAESLGVVSATEMANQLNAMTDGTRGVLGIYLLAVYVIDDTDFWSDGEVYWWSVPTIVKSDGTASWAATQGLPVGAPPHKCGDLEWLTNIAMKDPPLLAVMPPGADVSACVIRLAVYDDDGAVADFPKAMAAGYEALAQCKRSGLQGAESILVPVRDAIFKGLKGQQDDIIIEEDLRLSRDDARYGCGFVGSISRLKGRAYYFVKDELRTITIGPVALRKGQTETIKLDQPLQPGGRLAVFARGAKKGAEVSCGVLGELSTDKPFFGDTLDAKRVAQLSSGLSCSSNADASVILFYTPPDQ